MVPASLLVPSLTMFGIVNARMKNPKNLSWCLLFLCTLFEYSQAQIVGTHTFAPNADRTSRLSPQQQGQILSDIQQHQHRFDLSQNRQNFQPQHFQSSQNLQTAQRFQPFVNQQQLVSQSPLPTNTQENFARNEFLNTLPLLKSIPSNVVPTPQQTFQQISPPTAQTASSQVVFPSQHQQPTDTPKIVQHHTQTNFLPARQLISFGPQFVQPRPTPDPLDVIDQQIKQLDPEKNKQRIKELKEKQLIIEKHNQFVEKQYEKALKKAQEEHQDFIDKQRNQKKQLYQRLYKTSSSEPRSSLTAPRLVYPEEVNLFEQAVKQYYIQYPTTTTTTTTPKPTTTKKIEKLLPGVSFLPTALPQSKVKTIQSLDDLDQLQKEYKSQRIRKDDLLEQLRLAIGRNSEDESGKVLSSREISLANGKKIQLIPADDQTKLPRGKEEEITLPDGKKVTVIRADDPVNKSDEEVTLPSGHQVKIFRTTDPNSIPNISKGFGDISQEITLPDGQKAQLIKARNPNSGSPTPIEEIVLPNGQKVELIRTSDPSSVPDGVKVEPGSDLEKLVFSRTTTTTEKPPKEILDELTKSVPSSNFELLKTGASGGLESIGKNLPNQKKVTFVLLEEQSDGTLKVQGVKGNDKDKTVDVDAILSKIKRGEIKLPDNLKQPTKTTTKKPEVISTTLKTNYSPTLKPVYATITPNSFATEEPNFFQHTQTYENEESDVPALQTNIGTKIIASSTPATYFLSSTTTEQKKSTRTPHILNNSANDLLNQASTVQSAPNKNLLTPNPTEITVQQSVSPINLFPIQETFSSPENQKHSFELPEILKKNNLFAMSKFLRQSGLDTILNETGPYTVFVPTDKAFRTLLIQLGGPEKAEEKFKENPRLLSGLLLHHVIPGAFKISSLQDEMTGVSLAGTQLRVNQYSMHDKEWNDIKITTINGAKVQEESQDIDIPQGVAHAIDRVMFPLPVGDIVQTLQSDRERRFTSFLRAIFASGLDEMLQGSKIFTLLAPTEKAFAGLSAEDLSKLVTDKVLARELVLRHLIAGTLYTNGMRYYQIKDSLLQDRQITFSKQSGKVKVNNNLLTTQNIPATNGVIHAIDTLL
ncbi:uncharacterized protein [Diabrotica undecimpunctata]|uniref:uncharacterized protein isoform X2 n=1 Tax=Diabrotica undecimpunctata TaxID=50387 RepID=UPI003B633EE1